MKIALTSDIHLGITKMKPIKQLLQRIKKESPDIVINAGDNCGTDIGHGATEVLAPLFRKYFPNTEILWTNGNHDYWCGSLPKLVDFQINIDRIEQALNTSDITFIDKTLLSIPNTTGDNVHFIGVSGWYANPLPKTNDKYFLPKHLEEGTDRYLLKLSESRLAKQLEELDKVYKNGDTVIFISHFPVINTGDDYKGAFEDFSWSESIGKLLLEKYKCRYFLNGHAHQRHIGPLRYEAGSDYYRPNYLIIEI